MPLQTFESITSCARDAYAHDGVICLRGAFEPWVDTLHGAAGNEVRGRRRAFSARWVGDDAR